MYVQKIGSFGVVLRHPESFDEGLTFLPDLEEVGVRPTPVSGRIECGHHRPGVRDELVTFGEDMSTDEVLRAVRLSGSRPATSLETLAFLREHARVCADWAVVCLGTNFLSSAGGSRSTPHGVERVMCLSFSGGGRSKLMYRSPRDGWSAKVGWAFHTISLT